MPDTARLHKVMDHITSLATEEGAGIPTTGEPPRLWRQATWIHITPRHTEPATLTDQGLIRNGEPCGTAACFAGWTVLLFGEPGTQIGQLTGYGDRVFLPGSPRAFTTIAEYARELLGLNQREADELFRSGNSLQNLRELVDEFTEEDE